MPLISVEDQGFFTPGQIIAAVAERMIAQRQREEQLEREKQAFGLQQRVLGAQATTAEAKAGNVGTEIGNENAMAAARLADMQQGFSQRGQLFPINLRMAGTQADTATANLGRLNALTPLDIRAAAARAAQEEADASLRPQLDPLKVRTAAANTTVAEQNAIPTDEDAEITTDALGNITEKVKRTKAGQPFGSAVKVMKGNRPLGATGGATKIEYVKDPITGEVTQTLVTRVSPSGEMVQNVIPPSGGLDPTAPQPGAKQPPAKGPAKSAPAAKTTTFAALPIGAEFTQGGVRYKKTGETTAEPVK